VNTSITSCGNQTFSATVGVNTVKIFSNDTGNNTNVSSVSFSYDIQGPVITITSPLNTSYNTTNITLTYVATDTTGTPITCVRELNGTNSSISSCGNQTFGVSAGSNTVKVFSNDTGNNTNVSSVSFTVDTTAPTVIASGPNGTITAASTILNVTTNENATCKYDTTDQDYNTMANTMTGAAAIHNATVSGLVNATTYTYQVRCQDTAGNAMTTSSVISFSTNITTDITGPNAPGNLTTVQVSGTRQVNLTWSASGSADAVQYRVYRASSAAVTVNSSLIASLGNVTKYTDNVPADGTWNYTVTAVDTASNEGSAATAVAVTVNTADSTAPNAPSGLAAVQVPGQRTVNLTWTKSTSADSSSYNIYRALGSAVSSSSQLVATVGNVSKYSNDVPTDGTWNYTVTAIDTAGNENTTGATAAAVTIDLTVPVVLAVGPSAGSAQSSTSVALLVNTSEAATCKFDTSDTAYINMSNTMTGTSLTHNFTLTSLADGVHARYVRCSDSSGNNMTTSTVIWFSVNTTGNFNYTQGLNRGWNTLFIPQTGVLTTMGYNSSNTQNFNITYMLNLSLNGNYSLVYYNTDGTSSGWKSFNVTDWAGSDLKYINNTNDKPYWINMSAADRFEI